MNFDDMSIDEIQQVIADGEAVIRARQAESEYRLSVDKAVEAYATSQGLTVLQAWRALAPEGVDIPDDPEPEPAPDAPDYVTPTGAHDAYMKGDLVTFQGAVYRCRIDGCVWTPVAYPQGWEKVSN